MFSVEDKDFGTVKLVSRSRARVTDNEDPKKKGRIKVFHPLTGETDYITYLSSPGSFSVPEVDDVVYVEADCGYGSHLVAWGNLNKEEDDSPKTPDAFQRVTPTNRGFYTPNGYMIELDDGKGLAESGQGIRITAPNGAQISIDGKTDSINAGVAFGDTVELSAANGFQTYTPAAGGTSISQKSGAVKINGFRQVQVTDGLGGELNIQNGKVALGGNTAELLDLFDQDLDAFINNAPTLVSTVVGPGVLSPAVVTLLTNIKVLLLTIKGSL